MVDEIKVYISTTPELNRERELLGQLIAEIPVTLGWRIKQSPARGEPVDFEAVRDTDIHLLILGSDIQAPIGYEWLIARRSGLSPWLLLKKGVLQTQAAQDFIRRVGEDAGWRQYRDYPDLRRIVQRMIVEHLLARTNYYDIHGKELDGLQEWRNGLDRKAQEPVDETKHGAGESGVIISPERYVPRQGVLLKPAQEELQEE